jgi:oligopeptide transport system substrate-binding protein
MPAPGHAHHRHDALLFLLLALVLSACTSGGPRADGTPAATAPEGAGSPATVPSETDGLGGSFRYALSADPQAIDPRFLADEPGRAVADAVFDSLVALDTQLEVVPAAASSWDVNEDATEFTFHLVDGATFHDGSSVTAADFVRSFDRIASGTAQPRSLLAYLLAPVVGFDAAQTDGVGLAGLEAVDDVTLVIRLDEPFAEFVEVLAHPGLAPVPSAADEDPAGFGERPIGNGPFQTAEPWQHDQFVRVARFPDHHAQEAILDEVVFQIYADDPGRDAQYRDLEAGQLHFADVPISRLDQTIEEFGLSDDGYAGPGVLDGLTTTIYYYGFNTEQPPFDDPDVRRAVSSLIDRERIVRDVTRGTRRVVEGIVPPSIPGARRGACPYCTYDPELAVELIGERELDPIRIVHNTGRTHGSVARAVSGDIERALDIEVEVSSHDLQPLLRELRAGEAQVFRLGWEAAYPSPGAYLQPLFSSSAIGEDNLTRFADPEVDALLGEARAEQDEERRHELYQQIEERVLDLAVIAPVMAYEHDRVVAPNVRGFVYTAMGTVDLTVVWLEDQP